MLKIKHYCRVLFKHLLQLQYRGQLESIQRELETPTQFKGRLNELISQVDPILIHS